MITYILIKQEIFFQSSVDLLNVLKYKVMTANCLLCPTNSRKCKDIQIYSDVQQRKAAYPHFSGTL